MFELVLCLHLVVQADEGRRGAMPIIGDTGAKHQYDQRKRAENPTYCPEPPSARVCDVAGFGREIEDNCDFTSLATVFKKIIFERCRRNAHPRHYHFLRHLSNMIFLKTV